MKFVVVFVCSFCVSLSGMGQKVVLGPELGLNLIQLNSGQLGKEYSPGIHAGLTLDYAFSSSVSLLTGVHFSQGKFQTTSFDTTAFDFFGMVDSSFAGLDMNTYSQTTSRQTGHYLQLPIMANYQWKGLSVFGGGYIGYLLGGNRRDLRTSTTPFVSLIDLESVDPNGFLSAFLPPPSEEDFDETTDVSALRRFDYGLKGGVGYEMDRVGLQVSYQFGIPDFQKSPNETESRRNRFFQFSVRYLLSVNQLPGVSRVP